jgi:hypothetical protein
MYSVEYTCTSNEIRVTTNSIITARPSICVPTPSSNPPLRHQVAWCTTGVTAGRCSSAPSRPTLRPSACARPPNALCCPPSASLTRLTHCTSVPIDSRNDAPTAAMPISEPCRGMRLPKRRIATNDSAGISGISQA